MNQRDEEKKSYVVSIEIVNGTASNPVSTVHTICARIKMKKGTENIQQYHYEPFTLLQIKAAPHKCH